MDLNSDKNLEMAEVLLNALNPAARATLWLKMSEDDNNCNMNGMAYQNLGRTEPGFDFNNKRRYSERFRSRREHEGVLTGGQCLEPKIIR